MESDRKTFFPDFGYKNKQMNIIPSLEFSQPFTPPLFTFYGIKTATVSRQFKIDA